MPPCNGPSAPPAGLGLIFPCTLQRAKDFLHFRGGGRFKQRACPHICGTEHLAKGFYGCSVWE